jgi:hypothetical protein
LATITLFWMLGVEDERLLWAISQAATLCFLSEHVEAFNAKDKTIRFGLLTGEGLTTIIDHHKHKHKHHLRHHKHHRHEFTTRGKYLLLSLPNSCLLLLPFVDTFCVCVSTWRL